MKEGNGVKGQEKVALRQISLRGAKPIASTALELSTETLIGREEIRAKIHCHWDKELLQMSYFRTSHSYQLLEGR